MNTDFLIAGNWKMNLLPSEVPGWIANLATLANDLPDNAELLLCAPYTHLPALAKATFGTRIKVGAQDVSTVAEGARTGEVSAAMLKDVSVQYVLVGHSERREYHGEAGEELRNKLQAAADVGIRAIFCVGETLEQREAGAAEATVRAQLADLHGLDLPGLVVAYEPVWAIGTGKTASADDANAMCTFIQQELREAGRDARILYGGSMNADNARELLAQPAIQGGLIGGASLQPQSFATIARSVS